MKHLDDLGEDAIVADLVLRRLGATDSRLIVEAGDDGAVIDAFASDLCLVATIDPCPTPVVDILGIGGYEHWGRLSTVISLSDIAAMGAKPVALLSSTVMPVDMTVTEYDEFLRGLDAACREEGVAVAGGNVREGAQFAVTTVGLGVVRKDSAFLRTGGQVGDCLVAVGSNGRFWAGVALQLAEGLRAEGLPSALSDALFRPRAKLRESAALADEGVVRAAIDCSDGLGEAVSQLSRASGCGAVLFREALMEQDDVAVVANKLGIEELKLRLSWGDWQLLAAVEQADVERTLNAVRRAGGTARQIGELTAEVGCFIREADGSERSLARLMGSKRFESDSYFGAGITPFWDLLHGPPL